jgi:hypothetical protein
VSVVSAHASEDTLLDAARDALIRLRALLRHRPDVREEGVA